MVCSWHRKLVVEAVEDRICLAATPITFVPEVVDCCEVFSPKELNAADTDGDGDLDILVVASEISFVPGANVFMFENRAEGKFGPGAGRATDGIIQNFWMTRAVDIDGDSDLDLVGEIFDSGRPGWAENQDGMGLYSDVEPFPIETPQIGNLFFADLDNDKDADLVWQKSTTLNLQWMENSGNGTFGVTRDISGLVSEAMLVIGDVDVDGDVDILSRSTQFSPIIIHENVSNGDEFLERIVSLDGVVAENASADGDMELVDIDHDGDLDLGLIRIDDFTQSYSWLENDGHGEFVSLRSAVPEANRLSQIHLKDFDGDGDLDALAESLIEEGAFQWFENTNSSAIFEAREPGILEAINAHVQAAVWEDFDGDGDLDKAIVTGGELDDIYRLHWYENNDGLGAFSSPQLISPQFGAYIGAIDVDADGDLDILATSENQIVYYRNIDGRGSFGGREKLGGIDIRSISIVDFDSDGDEDIVAVERKDTSHPEIVWFENRCGEFTASRTLMAGLEVTAVKTMDIDGDGHVDLLAHVEIESQKVAVYRNTGMDEYLLHQIITDTSEGRPVFLVGGIEIVDLDRDGDLDLLISKDDDSVEWFENVDGLFEPRLIPIHLPQAKAVHVADLDGDEDFDLLVAVRERIDGRWNNHLHWHENLEGFGSFKVEPNRLTVANANLGTSIQTVDFDRDGDLDILFSGTTWFENIDGLGSFSHSQHIGQRVVGRTASVVVADFDADADSDIAAVSFEGNWLFMYENRIAADSNDDGKFNSSDLVQIFQFDEYEDDVRLNSTFNEGDWNGDNEFDSSDLVLAFQLGHYEISRRLAGRHLPAIDFLDVNNDERLLTTFLA